MGWDQSVASHSLLFLVLWLQSKVSRCICIVLVQWDSCKTICTEYIIIPYDS